MPDSATFTMALKSLINAFAQDGDTGAEDMANAMRAEAGSLCPEEERPAPWYDVATFDMGVLSRIKDDLATGKRCLMSPTPRTSEALIYIERIESSLDNAEIEVVPW